jgi:hypothetical protein
MNTNNCQRFAAILASKHGMTYAQATKKYVRGYEANTVYINATQTSEKAHCVHCARAEALSREVRA